MQRRIDESEQYNDYMVTLPNGTNVFQLNSFETELLYNEIYVNNSYLRYGVRLDDKACVLDIGANIGLFSLSILEKFPNSCVYAFEPAPPVFDILKKNLEKYIDRVKVFNAGVYGETCEKVFSYYPNLSISSSFWADDEEIVELLKHVIKNKFSFSKSEAFYNKINEMFVSQKLNKENYTCKLISLSDIIRENSIGQIDLLKVDAEKAERQIFSSLNNEDWDKIRQTALEVHDKDDLEYIKELLINKGFILKVDVDRNFVDTSIYNVYAWR